NTVVDEDTRAHRCHVVVRWLIPCFRSQRWPEPSRGMRVANRHPDSMINATPLNIDRTDHTHRVAASRACVLSVYLCLSQCARHKSRLCLNVIEDSAIIGI